LFPTELLKPGIKVAQSTVSIYMVPRPDKPLQTCPDLDYVVLAVCSMRAAALVSSSSRHHIIYLAGC
jgi:hypothetical protein